MDDSRFVHVVAELANGRSRHGTGYLLSRDRILTAHHVVADCTSIQVHWDNVAKEVETIAAEVLWAHFDEAAGIDVAVLGCETPVAVQDGYSVLVREALTIDSPWMSNGCAETGKDGSRVFDRLEPLRGIAYRSNAYAQYLKLEVRAEPAELRAWGGISGAPVVVDGRLYGILRGGHFDYEARRLEATPVHRLWGLEGFTAALGLGTPSFDKWLEIRRRLVELLAADVVAARTMVQGEEGWLETLISRGTEGLVTELCERCHIVTFLTKANKACSDLLEQGQKAPAETWRNILLLIVPILFERDLPEGLSNSGGALLKVPALTTSVAEIAIAAAECRATVFRRSNDPRRVESAFQAYHFGDSPDDAGMGIDPSGDFTYLQFVEDLWNAHLAADPVAQKQIRPLKGKGAEYLQFMVRALNDELQFLAERPDGTQRFVLCDSSFAASNQAVLDRVVREFPSLKVVILAGTDFVEEKRIERPLLDVLQRFEA